MIRLFVLSLVTAAAVLWLTVYLGFPSDPGYLLIAFGKRTFETSLLALLILISICYFLIKLVSVIFSWVNPNWFFQITKSIGERRKTSKKKDTLSGLLYLARGNWRSSYNILTKSANDENEGIINYLAAAYAAYRANEFQDSVKSLEDAERKFPENKPTINLLKSRLLYDSGQAEEAALLLNKIQKVSPNDSDFLLLAKNVQVKLKNWEELEGLIPRLKKNKVITSSEEEEIQVQILIGKLDKIWNEREGKSVETLQVHLKDLWGRAPARFRSNEKAVINYVSILIKSKARDAALEVLESALKKKWSNALVNEYGKQDFNNEAHQLIISEKWEKKRPDDANLLLCLGRISMKNKSWEKAKNYLKRSTDILPSAAGYGELSRLLKYLGDTEQSEFYLQCCLDLAGAELSDIRLNRDEERK